jgi:hypothetical protein
MAGETCRMANYLGVPLARLIRQRAYQAGEISRVGERVGVLLENVQRIQRELEIEQARKASLESRLQETDRKIESFATYLDVNDIRSIRPTPRSGQFQHGDLTRFLVDLLKSTEKPIPTSLIVQTAASYFGFAMTTAEERDQSSRRVKQPLKVMSRKGAVKRLHDRDKNLEC